MLQVAILFLLCNGAMSQILGFGGCPKVDVIKNFDLKKYLGVWYEAEKYFAIFEVGGKCISANYTLRPDGSVKVVNRQINSLTGNPSTIEGTAKLVNKTTTEGKLSIVFPSIPGQIPAPYWILDTDYTNYAVVLSCSDLALFHARIVWILTRAREPSAKVLEQARNVLKKNKMSTILLLKTTQKNCT